MLSHSKGKYLSPKKVQGKSTPQDEFAKGIVASLDTPAQAGLQAFLPSPNSLGKYLQTAVMRNRRCTAVRVHAQLHIISLQQMLFKKWDAPIMVCTCNGEFY
jgi:hypothetical protein